MLDRAATKLGELYGWPGSAAVRRNRYAPEVGTSIKAVSSSDVNWLASADSYGLASPPVSMIFDPMCPSLNLGPHGPPYCCRPVDDVLSSQLRIGPRAARSVASCRADAMASAVYPRAKGAACRERSPPSEVELIGMIDTSNACDTHLGPTDQILACSNGPLGHTFEES